MLSVQRGFDSWLAADVTQLTTIWCCLCETHTRSGKKILSQLMIVLTMLMTEAIRQKSWSSYDTWATYSWSDQMGRTVSRWNLQLLVFSSEGLSFASLRRQRKRKCGVQSQFCERCSPCFALNGTRRQVHWVLCSPGMSCEVQVRHSLCVTCGQIRLIVPTHLVTGRSHCYSPVAKDQNVVGCIGGLYWWWVKGESLVVLWTFFPE